MIENKIYNLIEERNDMQNEQQEMVCTDIIKSLRF